MRTLQAVKNSCRIDHGNDGLEHWFWQGARSGGYAFMNAPNFTADPSGQTCTSQRGRRAVWHILTSKPISAGVIIYNSCQEAFCVNPKHLKAGTTASYGHMLIMSGARKVGVLRRLASKKGAVAFRKITPEMAIVIFDSKERSPVLAQRYGVHKSTIDRYRSGQGVGLGGFFSGLMR